MARLLTPAELPMSVAWRTVYARVRASLDAVFDGVPKRSYVLEGVTTAAGDPVPLPVMKAAAAWRAAQPELDAVPDVFDTLARDLTRLWADADYTSKAKQTRAGQLVARATVTVSQHTVAATAQLDKLVEQLTAAALPARPEPADAAQEARLANLRADLRMVLDPVPADDVPKAIAARLEQASGDGDSLAVWLLGASRWPADYLSSRGGADLIPALDGQLAKALDGLDTGASIQVRSLHRAATDPRNGVPALKNTLGPYVGQLLRELETLAGSGANVAFSGDGRQMSLPTQWVG